MDNIKQATKAYERWVSKQVPLIPRDLRLKHQRMADSPFAFLRATFYRWVQLWPQVCPDLAKAPPVLGVGDLHIENFGTWRDCEGRLIWGVNDFDEAERMPYANDLVRLAVSAHLAIRVNGLSCERDDACDAIVAGYQAGLTKGGRPFVLAEEHRWLRDAAMSRLREPTIYWQRLDQASPVRAGVPRRVKAALARALPERGLPFRIVHRQAGLGSLGRRRFTALAQWRGGRVAREAKELRRSAWYWEKSEHGHAKILYPAIISGAVRVADPFLAVRGAWVIRRLAPDCSRIELGAIPKAAEELKLLKAMGFETANVHLGTDATRSRVLKHLQKQPHKWLRQTVDKMSEEILRDWKVWRS
jgi:uncharacterized protein (DUF2252 family)